MSESECILWGVILLIHTITVYGMWKIWSALTLVWTDSND